MKWMIYNKDSSNCGAFGACWNRYIWYEINYYVTIIAIIVTALILLLGWLL